MGRFNNPVILPKQQNPWENFLPTLLTNLALAKIQHNWAMDVKDKELEAEKLRVEEQRAYKESQAEKKSKQTRGQELRSKGFTPSKVKQGGIQEETLKPNQPAAGTYKDVHGRVWQRPQLQQGQQWRGTEVVGTTPGGGSDFEKAYQQWRQKNKDGTRAQFRQSKWLKGETTRNRQLLLESVQDRFGLPKDTFGRIQMLNPKAKKNRLVTWFTQGRQQAKKTHGLSEQEVKNIDTSLMAEYGMPSEIVFAINTMLDNATPQNREQVMQFITNKFKQWQPDMMFQGE